MAKILKRPAAIWAGVVWIGGLGVLIGSVVIAAIVPASAASNPPTFTANQGTAGSTPWPVNASQSGLWNVGVTSLPSLPSGDNTIGNVGLTGSVPAGTNTIGNVGITGSLPAGTNDIGTVNVAAPTPATGFSLCKVSDTGTNCASSGTGLATGTIVNTLSVRCKVASGQRAGAEFFNSNEYDIPLSFELTYGGVDVFTGTLTNLSIPIQSGGSWLNVYEDYTASSGNGADCLLFYVTTS